MIAKYYRLKRLKNRFPNSVIESDNVSITAELGDNVHIKANVSIGPNVKISDYSYVNSYTDVSSAYIGKFCSIAGFCAIGLDSHPLDWFSTSPKLFGIVGMTGEKGYNEPKPPPIIGNDVWIGAHVVIMRGVIIGDGAVIGAGSVVTKDIPAYAIAMGIPAKVKKYRFDFPTINRLIDMKWWDLPNRKIIEMKADIAMKDLFFKNWVNKDD